MEIGSIIVVQPGEKVPIDGVIVDGEASLNTSALTGESLPREAKTGDAVISGCIDMTGVLKIRTTKEIWRVYRIQDPGHGRKLQFEKVQIREFYFQICPLLYSGCLLWRAGSGSFTVSDPACDGNDTAVEHVDLPGPDFLVISCPCALVITFRSAFLQESAAPAMQAFW